MTEIKSIKGKFTTGRTYDGKQLITYSGTLTKDIFLTSISVEFTDTSRHIKGEIVKHLIYNDNLESIERGILETYDSNLYTTG